MLWLYRQERGVFGLLARSILVYRPGRGGVGAIADGLDVFRLGGYGQPASVSCLGQRLFRPGRPVQIRLGAESLLIRSRKGSFASEILYLIPAHLNNQTHINRLVK